VKNDRVTTEYTYCEFAECNPKVELRRHHYRYWVNNFCFYTKTSGPGSSVGIGTGYGLDGPGSNPSGDEILPPVHTGPGAHPASCKMGTGSFPGVKFGRGVLLNTHPLLVPRSWKIRAIPVPTLWATPDLWRDHFTFVVKPTRCTNVSNLFYFGMALYMFRTVFPSIISSSRLYIQQPYRYCCLLASKQTAVSVWHVPVAVCTVLNCWWWTERPSETCTVSFQNKINLIHWCIWLVLL